MKLIPGEPTEWKPSGNDTFTGQVWNARLLDDQGGLTLLAVRFAPGARSHWHSHPNGQTLYVVSGSGLVQNQDGTTFEITAGDTIFTPPGEVHWHGAGPDSPMMHLSLTTQRPTEWGRPVEDDEYRGR